MTYFLPDEVMPVCDVRLIIALSVAFVLWKLYSALIYKKKYYNNIENGVRVKGPEPRYPNGNAEFMAEGLVEGLTKALEYGDKERGMSTLFVYLEQFVIITHHEHVKVVLQQNTGRPVNPYLRHLKNMLGWTALSFVEANVWKSRRRIMGKAFRFANIEGMSGIMTETTAHFVSCLTKKCDKNPNFEFDMMKWIHSLALDIIGKAGFGCTFQTIDEVSETDDNMLAETFKFCLKEVSARMFAKSAIDNNPSLLWVPTPSNRKYRTKLNWLRDKIMEVVKQRRKKHEAGALLDKADLLNNMLAAQEDEDDPFTDEELRDNTMLLLFAGFDTSSLGIVYALMLLAQHPDKQKKMQEEVDALFDKNENSDTGEAYVPQYSDTKVLEYTTMVVQESLRLYPPAVVSRRLTTQELDFDGIHIPEGTQIFIPVPAVHRSAHNWQDPESFLPERFGKDEKYPFYAWVPFAGGPRNCVGQRFAMVETVLVLAMLIRYFEFSIREDYKLEFQLMGFVRGPKHGMPMTLRKRR